MKDSDPAPSGRVILQSGFVRAIFSGAIFNVTGFPPRITPSSTVLPSGISASMSESCMLE